MNYGITIISRYQQATFLCVRATIAAFLLFFSGATAQEMTVQPNNPDASFVTPRKKAKKLESKVKVEPPVIMNGVLVDAVRSKKPLNVINPLAPISEGDGINNISQDPDELGKPKGIIIFGVQW